MVLPSLACPADCDYCFGPKRAGPAMDRAVVEGIAVWAGSLGWEGGLDVAFHGGEPLTAGPGYFRMALERLAGGLGPCRPRFFLQSNLWLLTGELCEILAAHGVSIGTSLDGPEAVNDLQRGAGHFRRTMEGIELARSRGLEVGCVCTFTADSARRAEEVLEFFAREGLGFTIRPALPGVGRGGAGGLALSPRAYGELLVEMLDRYLEDPARVRIGTLDSLCRGVSAGRGGTCVFADCLGGYLAVGPDGGIFPCQRFAADPEWRVGSVLDRPSPEALRRAPAWRALESRQESVEEACAGCAHLRYCRGGCPYNALAAGGFCGSPRDPYCEAYRRIFGRIVDLALQEVFSPENIEAVVEVADPRAGLLRKGKLLSLMKDPLLSR